MIVSSLSELRTLGHNVTGQMVSDISLHGQMVADISSPKFCCERFVIWKTRHEHFVEKKMSHKQIVVIVHNRNDLCIANYFSRK
jgi:hypothetical protein